jgi:hypothetical protein
MTYRANQAVRCIESGHGEHGAWVEAGETYTVDLDQHPALGTVWIRGHGRWNADRFEPLEPETAT